MLENPESIRHYYDERRQKMEIVLVRFDGESMKTSEFRTVEERRIFEKGDEIPKGRKKGKELEEEWQGQVKAEGSNDVVRFVKVDKSDENGLIPS